MPAVRPSCPVGVWSRLERKVERVVLNKLVSFPSVHPGFRSYNIRAQEPTK
jgi:hypothetical protein